MTYIFYQFTLYKMRSRVDYVIKLLIFIIGNSLHNDKYLYRAQRSMIVSLGTASQRNTGINDAQRLKINKHLVLEAVFCLSAMTLHFIFSVAYFKKCGLRGLCGLGHHLPAACGQVVVFSDALQFYSVGGDGSGARGATYRLVQPLCTPPLLRQDGYQLRGDAYEHDPDEESIL